MARRGSHQNQLSIRQFCSLVGITGFASMDIKLKLFHNLRKLAFPGSREFLFDYPLPEGAKVSDLLERLNIPPELSILIFLNGEAATVERMLHEGDLVSLMLPAGGG
jgi:sulfur carrier protein ThiS